MASRRRALPWWRTPPNPGSVDPRRRRAHADRGRFGADRLAPSRPGRRRHAARPQARHPRVPHQDARAPAPPLRVASLRPLGAAPIYRATPTDLPAQVSQQHQGEHPNLKGLRPRRATGSAGWIWLCRFHAEAVGAGRPLEDQTSDEGAQGQRNPFRSPSTTGACRRLWGRVRQGRLDA